jgi:hypothetical protein
MNDLRRSGFGAAGLSGEELQELVQRIVASRPFARAPQVKDFLTFIVERSLTDDAATINETEIGRHVLRRQQSDFDPSTDNIVRVQARHLRKKLEEYFEGEGSGEPVVLTIPKGSYIPKLSQRGAPADPSTSPRPWRARLWLAAGGAVVLVVAGAWLVSRTGLPIPAARPAVEGEPDLLWSAFARTGRKTSIVLSDSSVSVVQNLLRKRLTLAQYLSPGYPREILSQSADKHSAEILGEITRYPYTSLNSAIVASKLHLSAKRSGLDATLRFPRDINIREFKSDNFLLIGSQRSVPWMELIEGQLNFTFSGNPQNLDFYISNKSPRAGEQPSYRPQSSGGAPTDYAVIALIPSLNGTGLLMCLQGMSGMANEAAEELISNPRTSLLHQILRSQPAGAAPHIEILLRATGMSGAPADVHVVATRIGAAPAPTTR